VAELFKRAGIDYEMTLRFPWNRLQTLAEQKPGFAVFSLSRTPEREPKYKWVGPLSEIQIVLLKMPGSPIQLANLDDAKKYSIGSKDGSVGSQYLINRGFELHNSLIKAPDKLKAGKFDLWATTNPSGDYEAMQAGIGALEVALTLNRVDLYLALNKETPDEVIQKLQRTLDQMKQEGLLQKATQRYMNNLVGNKSTPPRGQPSGWPLGWFRPRSPSAALLVSRCYAGTAAPRPSGQWSGRPAPGCRWDR